MIDLYSALYNRRQGQFENVIKICTYDMTNEEYLKTLKDKLYLFNDVDLIFVSLGFDMLSNECDGINLTYDTIYILFKILYSSGTPILFFLEGGYLMESLINGTKQLIYTFAERI